MAASDLDRAIGERLAAVRLESGLTQTQAGALVGRHQTGIAKLEHGDRRLLFSDALAFARIYKVPITSLDPDSL
jgi:transcriptional regulator with XRE-family HTH domain